MSDNDLIRRKEALNIRFSAGYNEDGRLYIPLSEFTAGIKALPAVPQVMSAREFLRDFHRLCQSMGCDECPITHDDEPRTCAVLMGCFPDETIETVEQWAKDHPEKRKTYAEDFREKFEKAYEANGHPAGCRNAIYYGIGCEHKYVSCEVCWNEEMEEQDE